MSRHFSENWPFLMNRVWYWVFVHLWCRLQKIAKEDFSRNNVVTSSASVCRKANGHKVRQAPQRMSDIQTNGMQLLILTLCRPNTEISRELGEKSQTQSLRHADNFFFDIREKRNMGSFSMMKRWIKDDPRTLSKDLNRWLITICNFD